MIKTQERINENGLKLKGKFPDIVLYLEREAERCPKMSVLQYIKLRRIEKAESELFGVSDIRSFEKI